MSYKAVILIGGQQHQHGSIFRPISLDLPTPLFPIAGRPLVQHQIDACLKVPAITEVLLIGCYNRGDTLDQFITSLQGKYPFKVRYLQEYNPMGLGTGGGLYHFRDHILATEPRGLFVFNCEVCCDFPLRDMIEFYESRPSSHLILATTVNEKQSTHYGCIVTDELTHQVRHYVEKPETFVSNLINAGIYLLSPAEFFSHMKSVFHSRALKQMEYINNGDARPPEEAASPLESVSLEHEFLSRIAGSGCLYAMELARDRFWSQIKTAGCAIYASRFYLHTYSVSYPEMLSPASDSLAPVSERGPCITGNVWIHPSAKVDPSAHLGPNVSIGAGVSVGAGVRVRESIVLDGARLERHACVLYSVVGWNCRVGEWSRVEGIPNDPDADDPHARPNADALFDSEGRLLPSTTILGQGVSLASEKMLLNCIVLPHKSLSATYKHQIIL